MQCVVNKHIFKRLTPSLPNLLGCNTLYFANDKSTDDDDILLLVAFVLGLRISGSLVVTYFNYGELDDHKCGF